MTTPLPAPPEALGWPPGTSWAWRPEPWAAQRIVAHVPSSGDALGIGVKIFHAGAPGPVRIEPGDTDGLVLRMTADAGDFVSLAIDLEAAALRSLTRRSIVRLAALGQHRGGGSLYGRINLRHGPNTASQTRRVSPHPTGFSVEFDLAQTELDHIPMSHVWVDLLVGQPTDDELILSDLVLSCHPRAEI